MTNTQYEFSNSQTMRQWCEVRFREDPEIKKIMEDYLGPQILDGCNYLAGNEKFKESIAILEKCIVRNKDVKADLFHALLALGNGRNWSAINPRVAIVQCNIDQRHASPYPLLDESTGQNNQVSSVTRINGGYIIRGVNAEGAPRAIELHDDGTVFGQEVRPGSEYFSHNAPLGHVACQMAAQATRILSYFGCPDFRNEIGLRKTEEAVSRAAEVVQYVHEAQLNTDAQLNAATANLTRATGLIFRRYSQLSPEEKAKVQWEGGTSDPIVYLESVPHGEAKAKQTELYQRFHNENFFIPEIHETLSDNTLTARGSGATRTIYGLFKNPSTIKAIAENEPPPTVSLEEIEAAKVTLGVKTDNPWFTASEIEVMTMNQYYISKSTTKPSEGILFCPIRKDTQFPRIGFPLDHRVDHHNGYGNKYPYVAFSDPFVIKALAAGRTNYLNLNNPHGAEVKKSSSPPPRPWAAALAPAGGSVVREELPPPPPSASEESSNVTQHYRAAVDAVVDCAPISIIPKGARVSLVFNERRRENDIVVVIDTRDAASFDKNLRAKGVKQIDAISKTRGTYEITFPETALKTLGISLVDLGLSTHTQKPPGP